MTRHHYKPHLSWWPIVPVRWRSKPRGYGAARLGWRLYLFGVLPLVILPRRQNKEMAS